MKLMRDNNFDLMDTGLELGGHIAELLGSEMQRPAHLLKIARLARKSGQLQRGLNALYRIETFSNREFFQIYSLRVLMEKAQIFWKQQDWRQAIQEIKKLIKFLTDEREECLDNEKGVLLSEALCFLGKWTAETRLGSGNEIIENYFMKAIDSAITHHGNTTKMYFTLAKYADHFYQCLRERQDSSEWTTSQAVRREHQKQLQKLKTASRNFCIPKNVRSACSRHANALSRQLEVDMGEYHTMEKELDSFLETAIKNYINCLTDGTSRDVRAVFRLCSLWFANSDRESINKLMEVKLDRVSSYKFLPLAYQIVSRISDHQTRPLFGQVLRSLICRIAGDHPHHILWHLIALTKGLFRSLFDFKKTVLSHIILGGKTSYKSTMNLNSRMIVTAQSLLALTSRKKEQLCPIIGCFVSGLTS